MRTGVSISRHFIPPLGQNLLLALAGLLLITSYSFPQYSLGKKHSTIWFFPLLFQMKNNRRAEQQITAGRRSDAERLHPHLTKEREGWMLLMMGSWLKVNGAGA